MSCQRAGVGPAEPKRAGEHARRQPVLAHADQHEPRLARRSGAELEQRHAVAQARQRRGDLDDLRAGRRIARTRAGEIDRARRRNRATTARSGGRRAARSDRRSRARHSMSTYSAPSASASASIRRRSSSEPANCAAFPRRPAGDDHRPAPSGERAGDVGIADACRAAARPDRRRRPRRAAGAARPSSARSRSRTAAVCIGPTNKKSLFNRWAEEAWNSSSRSGRSGQGGCLFSRCSNTTATPNAHTAARRRGESVGTQG